MGLLSTIVIEIEPELTMEELCQAFSVTPDYIDELMGYGVIQPIHPSDNILRFNAENIRRLRRMVRLQREMELNIPGAALAIELLDEIERLKSELALWQKNVILYK